MACLLRSDVRTAFDERCLSDALHQHLDACYGCALEFAKLYVIEPGPMFGPRTVYEERYLRTTGQDGFFPPHGIGIQ